MNPLTNMKNVQKLSEQELSSNMKTSWHDQYKNSAWIFIGGLPYDLTEGDVICVFSQYGEIVNINLVRDKASGKTKGFCFLCYEDQRSTILAVDNLNGIKILGRTIRVDHVHDYKAPKEKRDMTAETVQLLEEGCAANPVHIKNEPPSPEWRKQTDLSHELQHNSAPLKTIKNKKLKEEKKINIKRQKQSKGETRPKKKSSKSKRPKKSRSSSASSNGSSGSSESSSTESSSDTN